MGIWRQLYGGLQGGWKTYGPNSIAGNGAFHVDDGEPFSSVSAEAALGLSAVHACISLRAEVIGTLPLHLRNGDKKILTDHPLYNILHRSPNADQTAAEYESMVTAHVDMFGNAVSIIERGVGKKVVALTPCDPTTASYTYNKSGSRKKWKIGQDEHGDDDILHHRGFTMNAGWGAPRIDLGRQILQAQLTANRSAMQAFKQGLKVGGFFLNEGKSDPTTEQLKAIHDRLNFFGRPENAGKWMVAPRNFKPIAGTEFSVRPADAQLLESRHFGIEEICRLFNTPPQLIGHTSKASSWASSLENVNLHFVIYSLTPTLVRREQRIEKKLLTPYDIAEGVQAKYSIQGLLRGDTKTRQAFYASGLQNGYLSQNEVRDLEDRPGIGPEGDIFRVQLNMAGSESTDEPKPKGDTDENQDA